MCGIFVSARLSQQEGTTEDTDWFALIREELQKVNGSRGPDAQNAHLILLESDEKHLHPSAIVGESSNQKLAVEFYASELRLRGDRPIVQPHVANGNVLCWNGEVFDGMVIKPQENDGSKLLEALCLMKTAEEIRDLFSTIEGPYAFVFYHALTQHLYFARDPLGRRSLLVHWPTNELPYLLLSSVSAGVNSAYDFEELSTEHVCSLDLQTLRNSVTLAEAITDTLGKMRRTPSMNDYDHRFAEVERVNTTSPPRDHPAVQSLDMIPEHLLKAVDDLICHLDRSVMLRVRNIPHHSNTPEARVAVLFSGGIDSAVITFLANRHIPLDEPIDLLNVAFENPHKIKAQQKESSSRKRKAKTMQPHALPETTSKLYQVPDRVTGLTEVEELRRICPGRTWNFVEVNVPYEECQAARTKVESLMAPGKTVMDLASDFSDLTETWTYVLTKSLALALYFASRGQGQVRKSPEATPKPYISNAKVLLNGLGSDELLGGYGRHRTVYNSGGWQAVIAELQQDIDRIPTRNLGRDDRVISSHGKETRHPFLSLSLVSFLATLPMHFKMDPRLPVGLGEKVLLRLAAYKLGMVEASSRKKRAMQFGTHSARMDGERRGDAELE